MKCIKVIFLGYAVNPLLIGKYSGVSVAGNKMQVNLLQELNKIEDIDLHIITITPAASFPYDKKIHYKYGKENINKDLMTHAISFWNFPVVKQFSQSRSVYRQLKRELENSDINNTILLAFNMFPQVGIPTIKAIKKFGVQAVSLLADLPIDDAVNRKGISKWLRKKFDESTQKSILKLKNLIVLNRNAVTQFAPDADFIVIDGGISSNAIEKKVPDFKIVKKRKNMVYGGSLNQYSGILNLAKAMAFVPDKEIFLDIYGSGEGEAEIAKLASNDSRIRFFGKVSNEVMMKKQREAYLLVNPRPIDDPISMVTFPSKIFEYMLSGTPIISTKLNGFTEEYTDKMFFFCGQTEKDMAKTILDIMKKNPEELVEYAERAYRFVSEERTWEKQVEKISKYIHDII